MKPTRFARRPAKPHFCIQSLEPRCLLTATLLSAVPNQTLFSTVGATTVNLNNYFDDPTVTGTAIEIQTSLGTIPLALTDKQTPLTVKNFVSYIDSGEYADTIIHRSVPGFVIQGGGYTPSGTAITTFAPVQGEPGFANDTGTIAMALSNGPNTGTSQWFINLADNTGLNGTSDGGPFTVFGSVIYDGMTVVDAIAKLTVVDDSAQNPAWSQLPVSGYSGSSVATSVPSSDLVQTNTVVVQPLGYTAVSADPSIVTASVSNGTLTLTPVPGQSGDTSVTVTATDLGGGTATSQFNVFVSNGAALTVAIGTGQAKSVAYTDADGTRATVTLKGPGEASVNFVGSGITQTSTARGVTVVGSGVTISGINTVGTTAASTLSITTVGGTRAIDVGSIATSSLRSITAPGATLTGDLSSSGSIGSLTLAGANSGVLSATSIGNIVMKGAFSDNVTLGAGGVAINRFVAGSIGAGTWGLTGSVNTIAAGSISGWNIGITQSVRSIVVSKGNFSGTFTANSVGTFIVRGSVLNSTIEVSATGTALRLLSVTGSIQESTVNSVGGNIGTVVAGSLLNSKIYAGLAAISPSQVLPDFATDFAALYTIAGVILRRPASGDSFTNSDIAAATINVLSLGTLATGNGGNPTGVASENIRVLSAVANKAFALTKLNGSTDLATILANRNIVLGDFLIKLF